MFDEAQYLFLFFFIVTGFCPFCSQILLSAIFAINGAPELSEFFLSSPIIAYMSGRKREHILDTRFYGNVICTNWNEEDGGSREDKRASLIKFINKQKHNITKQNL